MRRTLTLIMLVVLAASAMVLPTKAQDNAFHSTLEVGPSFGMNFSFVSFSPRVLTTMKQGINFGATIRWTSEPHLGIQAEINYSQIGWQERFDDDPEYHYSRTINYIELPFLTHIYTSGSRVRFIFNLGPKIGYALSESTDSNLNGVNPNENRPDEQHELAIEKRFDWGLCGGPGLELHTGIGSFLLEARYCFSLGDIYNSRKSDPFAKSSNQVIAAKFTYLFPIRGK